MKSKSPKKVATTRKELKGVVIAEMENGLPQLKESLGEKKFNKRMKKAANLLTKGLSKKSLMNENPSDK